MDNGHIRKRNNGGFTLLELMIVIVILGILGAIVAPKFMDEPHKARVVQAKMQIENLSTAVKKFYLDNGFYPSTEQGLEALVTRPAIGKTPKNYPANGYITKIPKDPWGNDYVYTAPGQKVPFEIMSLGRRRRRSRRHLGRRCARPLNGGPPGSPCLSCSLSS